MCQPEHHGIVSHDPAMTYSSQTRALGVSTLGLLIYNPREKYVNIPSEKYFYVHIYVCICVYTYLCKMDEYRFYAGLS